MKKKIMALVAALAIMTVGTTAFAAESPTKDTAAEAAAEAAATTYDKETSVDGDGFKVVQTPVEAAVVTEAETAAKDTANGTLTAVVDLKPEGDYTEGTAVKLTVKNAAVKANRKYVVLHQKSDNTWEQLAATVAKDGELTFTTTSFSAFAIVDIGEAAADTTSDTTTTTTTTTDAGTSPKTGETTPVALFALLACVAGALACSKKSEQ